MRISNVSPRKWLLGIAGVGVFFLGYGVSWIRDRGSFTFFATSSREAILGSTLRDDNTSYAFIKPLLFCGVNATAEAPELEEMKAALASIVDEAQAGSGVETMSVYFRDLDSGAWIATNDDARFAPASLMKVPILLSYLKQAETDADLLAQSITVKSIGDTNGYVQEIVPSDAVKVGETYTIEDLLRYMIVYSDNGAMVLLESYLNADVLTDLLDDLDVPPPGTDYVISTREYSRFLRLLYNGTYLARDNSEYALKLLSQAEFGDGIVAGVPVEAPVAHKFGESSVVLESGTVGHELHDCGIVYASSPYVLCVMSQGTTFDGLSSTIAKVSEAVWAFTSH